MYYVYLLKSEKDNKFYTGYTSDLKRRLLQHNHGENTSTAHRIPLKLVYYEAYASKDDAIIREQKLKQFKNGRTRLLDRLKNSLLK